MHSKPWFNLTADQARAIHKSILRNHPFFQSGGMFGFDWRTFAISYPSDAKVLRFVVERAEGLAR
jgi:hypothetical protein